MTSHELARNLLEMEDLPVVVSFAESLKGLKVAAVDVIPLPTLVSPISTNSDGSAFIGRLGHSGSAKGATRVIFIDHG